MRAFVPFPLPPVDPPLRMDDPMSNLHSAALAELARLAVTGSVVPNTDWFLYSFVRKEAVITSQIEGTQATLQDVVEFEATKYSDRPNDVHEVVNYIAALEHTRAQIADPNGLPLSIRLLCEAHRILMTGVRGENKQPGKVRSSQNWIGGGHPGNAHFVPPPPDEVAGALGALEKWLHEEHDLPSLVRIGLAHVQFETIHPFLDGNGRIGRLLIALLLEHWGLLDQPLLYLSAALKQDQEEYYARLDAVRRVGDWEGWTRFFLGCVQAAAADGVRVAQALHTLIGRDRSRVLNHDRSTIATVRLLDCLPSNPVVTNSSASALLDLTAPTVRKAIGLLENLGVLREVTGRRRDRVYAYQEYLQLLTDDSA